MPYVFPPGTFEAATYAWIIDRDHLDDEKPGRFGPSAVGTAGPRDAPDEALTALRNGEGRKWRCLDGDGIVYYSGRIITAEPAGSEDDFGPLTDFAQPDSGAAEIEYWEGGRWVGL